MEWHKEQIDRDEVRSISARYGVGLLTASILVRRGITEPSQVKYYLEKDIVHLHNPFQFIEMEDVIDRITRARDEEERAAVFGDRDADGITSTVLMVEALRDFGIETQWYVPQGDDPYGLTTEAIDELAAADGSLMITVDCGISNHDEVSYALERGIDTIIIDHHNPQEVLPDAYAVINPKVSESGYPFRDLAGCGVTSKVIWALQFSKLPLYNRTVCLLNVRPGNETLVLEAVLLTNLVEVDRITENIVPGMVGIDQTRLGHFLSGREIFVYDEATQLKLLRRIFGPEAEIGVTDIAPDIQRVFPSLGEMSLYRMSTTPKITRYDDGNGTEIDVLKRLFVSYLVQSEESISEGFRSCLDLVAIGTLADLMPLQDENRILVNVGLERINDNPRGAIRDLITRTNLSGKRISTTDISWQISPLINATGRLGVPNKAVELFLCEDEVERMSLVDEILGLNNERKRLGEHAWESVLSEAKKSYSDTDGRLIQVGGNTIHRGITGIIASRLSKYFNAPAMVVSLMEGRAVGSARSVKGINIKRFLDSFSDIFVDYGGHDYAAGYSMKLEDYERFQKRLFELAENLEMGDDEQLLVQIDAELPQQYMTPKLIDVVERFAPFGEANPPLVFVLRRAKIVEMKIIGRKDPSHLRLLIDSGKHKWPAVFWNSADRVNKDFALNDTVDIAFRLGRNYFQNRENIQLTILDIKR